MYPFNLSLIFIPFPYFTQKLFSFFFLLHPVVGLSSCILHLLLGRIFFCYFGMSWVFFVLLDPVLVSLKSLFFRQNLLIYLFKLSDLSVVFWSFHPNMSSRVLFLSFVIAICLYVLQVEFLIKDFPCGTLLFSQTNFTLA